MNKFFTRLFRIIEVMIAVFLGLMILLVFANVLGRYLFNIGFVWSEEMARLCFIFLVYLGSIEAMRDNRHLLVDTFLLKFSKVFQTGIYALTQIGIMWVMYILARGAWGLVLQNRNNVWIATNFPWYIVHFFGCLLGVSVILISVLNLVRLFVLKIPVEELIRMRNA
jgi:TRAP-type C4-dicarboxylate transport system permease small subunit